MFIVMERLSYSYCFLYSTHIGTISPIFVTYSPFDHEVRVCTIRGIHCTSFLFVVSQSHHHDDNARKEEAPRTTK